VLEFAHFLFHYFNKLKRELKTMHGRDERLHTNQWLYYTFVLFYFHTTTICNKFEHETVNSVSVNSRNNSIHRTIGISVENGES
jgi:hypothetical protein